MRLDETAVGGSSLRHAPTAVSWAAVGIANPKISFLLQNLKVFDNNYKEKLINFTNLIKLITVK